MHIEELLLTTKEMGASDLHITVGVPPVVRIHGALQHLDFPPLTPRDTEVLVQQLLFNETLRKKFEEQGETDFAFGLPAIGRYRVNVYKQRGTCAAALRNVCSSQA